MSEVPAPRPSPAPAQRADGRPLQAAAAAPAAEPRADDRVSRIEQLERSAKEAFPDAKGKLSIRYDEPTGRFIYRELDPQTGEVLKEFPPQEVLDRLARMKALAGATVDRKA